MYVRVRCVRPSYFVVYRPTVYFVRCTSFSRCCQKGIAEFAGLENDGVEQEQTYILAKVKVESTYVHQCRNIVVDTEF